jgi:hypothetical protein
LFVYFFLSLYSSFHIPHTHTPHRLPISSSSWIQNAYSSIAEKIAWKLPSLSELIPSAFNYMPRQDAGFKIRSLVALQNLTASSLKARTRAYRVSVISSM